MPIALLPEGLVGAPLGLLLISLMFLIQIKEKKIARFD
jgi:hypothetical protein